MRHHSSQLTVALALATSALVACATTPEGIDGDPIDDDFLGEGKSDAAGIAEGSPEAGGVLRVANALGGDDSPEDLEISDRAADAIVAYRVGGDGLMGTADDRIVDTLTLLDSIPWVGVKTFNAMLSYARANGYVSAAEPWDAGYCGADLAMTSAQMRAKFEPGTNYAMLSTALTWKTRSRTCETTTGCSAWTYGDPSFHTPGDEQVNLSMRDGEVTHANIFFMDRDAAGDPILTLNVWTERRLNWNVGGYHREPDKLGLFFGSALARTALTNGRISIGSNDQIDIGPTDQETAPAGGTLGNHCLRLVQSQSVTTGSTTETNEMVIYGTY